MVPQTRSRLRFHFPWRALLAGFVTIVLVKGFLIYWLTTDGYVARMEDMLAGSKYQELAAHVLTPDPVSTWTAARMADIAGLFGVM
ncbi:hypothetical protein HKCCE3408_01940 [Rhodobacterales bacterium HKCCE3408]|nr:hypothetical protein [Rhodobacterales bacterium HKCCE3408]